MAMCSLEHHLNLSRLTGKEMMTAEGRNGSTDAVNDRDEQVGVAGRMGSGNRGAGPQLVFGPHIEADGITMSFRRMLKWDGETVGESCLWRHRMESSDELERVFGDTVVVLDDLD